MALSRDEGSHYAAARPRWIAGLGAAWRRIKSDPETWLDARVGAGAYARLFRHRFFLLFVVLPVVLVGAYYYLVSADQYLSEAHFVVVSGSSQASKSTAQALDTSAQGSDDMQTLSVLDFLQSREAADELRKRLDVVKIYRRPWLDIPARIGAHPSLEDVYKYLFGFGQMVSPYYDFTSGVGVVKVYAFSAEDSHAVAATLLDLGDKMVARINQRAEDDALRVARAEVSRAQQRLLAVDAKVTAFRLKQQNLDFDKSAGAVTDVIGKLEQDLASARADLTQQGTYLKPDSPAFREQQSRVAALQSQIVTQQARLTGPSGAMAPQLAVYQQLMLDQDFANKDLEAALQAMEDAYLAAAKQHLFVVHTVEPGIPEEAEYPRRLFIILSVLVTLLVAYGVGWLILAGVREHGG